MLWLESKKLFKNVWVVPMLVSMVAVWWGLLLSYLPKESESLWLIVQNFWSIPGSIMFGAIILLINTKIFILDVEEGMQELVMTTCRGGLRIFVYRFVAALFFTTFILLFINIIQLISLLIFIDSNLIYENLGHLMNINGFVWLGSLLFSMATACLCTLLTSHTITVITFSLLFAQTYLIRGSMVDSLSIYWFLEKGFFSYFMRAKNIVIEYMLFIWYIVLMGGLFMMTVHQQTRRRLW